MDISLPDAESTVEFGRQLGRALNEQYAEGGEQVHISIYSETRTFVETSTQSSYFVRTKRLYKSGWDRVLSGIKKQRNPQKDCAAI